MIGMVFLISEVILGTWTFSAPACTTYLIFDSLNKFMAPIIALLISRTCYASVCLNPKYQERAANLKFAFLQVSLCLVLVMIVLWPVFTYSGVDTLFFNANHTEKSVFTIHKCNFQPPPKIQLGFSIIACIANYAIPLAGILYWYLSVPYFLRRRAETTLVGKSGLSETAIRKVITTALVLTFVYIACWSPYWIFLFAHQFTTDGLRKPLIILSYFIHLLPYISCTAYPLIFTGMNRAIKHAHAQLILNQRRKLRSFTDGATRQVREKLGIFHKQDRSSSPFIATPTPSVQNQNLQPTSISTNLNLMTSPSLQSFNTTGETELEEMKRELAEKLILAPLHNEIEKDHPSVTTLENDASEVLL
uniref:G-protein coupled receptors family 1 profile domain-containing protein n=1 Tax=Panagrolaimus sp. PS1159 TaxID=55785 RepID=A0AC35G8R5_9BILA